MKWISVKEKMPEKGERVLLYVVDKPLNEDSLICCGNFFDNERVPSKFQLDGDTVPDMLRDDREITHWMPLPQRPILPKVLNLFIIKTK